MIKRKSFLITLFALVLPPCSLVFGQSAITTWGVEATGSGGTASGTIGQVVYATTTTDGTYIGEGVQQPYVVTEVTEPCSDFVAFSQLDCDQQTASYSVILTIVGGGATNYEVASTHEGGYNGVVASGSIVDGPFPNGSGIHYTITTIGGDGCSSTISQSIVECIVTPVTLLSFTGRVESDGHLLEWVTGQEANASHIDLYRKHGGEEQRIYTTAAMGAGYGYQYLDQAPAGWSYYRLELHDVDGRQTDSEVVALYRPPAVTVAVHPNPATDQLVLTGTTGGDYRLLTIDGKLVQAGTTSPGETRLSVGDYPAGTYLLQLSNQTFKIQKLK